MKIKALFISALLAIASATPAFAQIKIGFLVPDSGPAGLFGPSTRNSALLAMEDINAAGGINGEPIELVFADAGLPPADVVQSAIRLWRGERVAALVGMHDSAVRAAVQGQIAGKLPYVYTPVHAGGKCTAGIYITGETPNQQLVPSIPYLMAREGVSSSPLKTTYLLE